MAAAMISTGTHQGSTASKIKPDDDPADAEHQVTRHVHLSLGGMQRSHFLERQAIPI